MSTLLKFFGTRHTDASENSEAKENEKKSPWSKFDELPLEEKRQLYRCGTNFVTLKDILSWTAYRKENLYAIYKRKGKKPEKPSCEVNELLNEKISLWKGDITTLEIDAIVNAANNSLLGGGGVDGCIHRAAGSTLRNECAALNGCSTGDAKITSGHRLPAKYVIHTVGPFGKHEKPLKSCYKKCLGLVKKHDIRTVAFCCISTGIYGYPIYDASSVALNTVRKWLDFVDQDGNKNAELVDRIIFCVFLGDDLEVYHRLLPRFFPSADKFDQESGQEEEEDTDNGVKDSGEHEIDEHKPSEDKGEKHSSNEDTKDKDSSGGDNKDDINEDEEEESGKEEKDVEMDEAAMKDGVPDPPAREDSLDSQEDVGNVESDKLVNQNIPSEKQDTSMDVKLDAEMDEAANKDGVPDPPAREDLLDSQEDVGNVESDKLVNQNIPSEKQDTPTDVKLCETSLE